MKQPERPPPLAQLLARIKEVGKFMQISAMGKTERSKREYIHWDKLRRMPTPAGVTHEDWWLALKVARTGWLRPVPLKDLKGREFQFGVPDFVQQGLHEIDIGAGGAIGVPEPITNAQTRDRYLIRSLIEEAITSSQLEGAATTREVAKEMIRSGRPPRDTSEQMILNNFVTMQRITQLKGQALTPHLVFDVHWLVTEKTLDDPTAAGRFRRSDEHRVVGDDYGEVFHEPPPAGDLPARMAALCEFANGSTPGFFVHPVVRAIIVHFWLAYDHPFVDGNGRTARALFYWAMLHHGCWLFEFISISNILRKAPIEYYRSFLHTETDDNDLTYFIVAQTKVIRRAIMELHAYIDRKTEEVRQMETHLRSLDLFNHRQADLIRHALKHPAHQYTIGSHQKSHNVVYQTARADLLGLKSRGALDQMKRGKKLVFTVPRDLNVRLRTLDKQTGA